MGNKPSSPFPSYEKATSSILSSVEIEHITAKFYELSGGLPNIDISAYGRSLNRDFIRKRVLPRLLLACDTKKDNFLDLEEYICAIAMFRAGITEDKIKLLFLMYESSKSTSISKANIHQLLIDALLAIQLLSSTNASYASADLEKWVQEQSEISEFLVDLVFYQFASQENKLEFSEFSGFVQMDGTIQAYLTRLKTFVDV